MSNPDAILFLGSGATAASGLTHHGFQLPTDGCFFGSDLVKKLVPKGDVPCGYPAVRAARQYFGIQSNGLYNTWQDLFIAKSFSLSGVIKPGLPKDIFATLTRLVVSRGQRKHYRCQKQIFESSDLPLAASNWAELAIWDLRVLVKKVYEWNSTRDPRDRLAKNYYHRFWRNLHGRVAAVVNLNYDTTFDKSLDNISCPIIRPHGSLRWSTWNRMERGKWKDLGGPWPSDMRDTPLDGMGYRKTSDPEIFSFNQTLIVTPESFKETVVGNSSMIGLQDPILKNEWQKLRRLPSKANHWLIFGLSLASGDDHLIFLLKTLGKERPRTLHVSCFRHPSCEPCAACEIAKRLSMNKLCIHPIENYIHEFTKSAPQRCVFKS
jgi:hypothetical protein